MSKRIFVTATNTNIGKTFTSQLLIGAFSRMGLRVGVYKPIETGVTTLPADGEALFQTALSFNPELASLSIDDIVTLQFPLPAAPFVANKGEKIDLSRFDTALAKIEALCDIIIIEGAGGLMVPIDDENMMIDLPRHFNAATFLVTHCNLGCINDTLLSINALENAALPYVWGLNCRSEDTSFETVSLPYFSHRFNPLFLIEKDIDAIAKALLDTISS
ncbi:dethiobiotin synthase [Sulfuricurvum sp.]|uniref:dethiobiotin synthase n=1 Tax=Sulfuricurvum sp. TaxID=2025608 RepID=UPI002606335E|nr:dethiobiotin synthase [Sulfuricurvum sp.]MDD2266558.1 dethiobiotin synthase [Sulfuricurvum sp.]MDD2783430.1 dethiobiotin synthase [Sulfuricurvum sp.]